MVCLPSENRKVALPRQRLTAGALIRDSDGRVLLVEPTYRPDWLTPGGSVEAAESPARAASREILEELGLPIHIGRLLVMQWSHEDGEPDGVLNFTYDAGDIDTATAKIIRLETGLAAFRFVPIEVVGSLASQETADRVEAAVDAQASGRFEELGR